MVIYPPKNGCFVRCGRKFDEETGGVSLKPTNLEVNMFKTDLVLWMDLCIENTNLWISWENCGKPRKHGDFPVDICG